MHVLTHNLQIYALPNLSKPVYVAAGLTYVPPFLSADYAVRRGTVQETLTELLVADLGDTTATSPYLIVSFFLRGISRHRLTRFFTRSVMRMTTSQFTSPSVLNLKIELWAWQKLSTSKRSQIPPLQRVPSKLPTMRPTSSPDSSRCGLAPTSTGTALSSCPALRHPSSSSQPRAARRLLGCRASVCEA